MYPLFCALLRCIHFLGVESSDKSSSIFERRDRYCEDEGGDNCWVDSQIWLLYTLNYSELAVMATLHWEPEMQEGTVVEMEGGDYNCTTVGQGDSVGLRSMN